MIQQSPSSSTSFSACSRLQHTVCSSSSGARGLMGQQPAAHSWKLQDLRDKAVVAFRDRSPTCDEVADMAATLSTQRGMFCCWGR